MWLKRLFKSLTLQRGGESKEKQKIDFDALPNLLTIEQVSEILGVHPNTLRNWDKAGKLKAIRLGPRRDRRYEKESVRKMYHTLLVPEKRPVPAQHERPEENYVLRPAFSWRWLRLFLISKHFSVFVYSAYLIAFTFAVVQVTFFAYMYQVQAEMRQPEIFHYQLAPAAASGWQSPQQAQHIDLLSSTALGEFTDKNSAVFINQPVTGAPDEENLAGVDTQLNISGFSLPATAPPGGILKKASIVVSMSAETYPGSEDSVALSYSLDGQTWTPLETLSLSQEISNAAHGGFWNFPFDLQKVSTPDDFMNLQVQIDYSAQPGARRSAFYVDGLALNMDIQEAIPVIEQIEQSVAVAKADFRVDEQPKVSVDVEDKKFLGIGTQKRTVKEVHIIDPSGREMKKEDIKVKDVQEGKITRAEYAVDTTKFNKPGKYTVSFTIEQGGETKVVTRDFTWGVLVMNTMKSMYRPGETANFGMGVLDSKGDTICDADLVLTITTPDKKTKTLTTKDGTIVFSKECGPNNVTSLADYSAEYIPDKTGEYPLELKATTKAGDYTITDTLHVQDKIDFDITRLGPTRIWPGANYQMFLEVIPTSDYAGVFEESVPASFSIPRVDQDGLVSPVDAKTQAIRWIVDWKAGQSYTLSYEMDPPNISPEIFLLGPAKAGKFTELRQWQIASDAACSAAATGNWNVGANWSGCLGIGGVPAATDTITMSFKGTGYTITGNVDAEVAGITLGGVAGANGLTINSEIRITNTGSTTFNAQTGATDATLAVGDGRYDTTSISISGGATAGYDSVLSVNVGEINASGSITCDTVNTAQQQITFSGAGTINVAGDFASGITACTLTPSTGKVKMTASAAAATLGNYTYNNVEIATTNSRVISTETGATTTIGGTLTITSGTLRKVGAALTVTGATSITGTLDTLTSATGTATFSSTIIVNSGGTFNLSGVNPAATYGGNITNSSTNQFKSGSGTTTFNASISLLGSGTGGFLFAQDPVTIAAGITITNGNTGGTATFTKLTIDSPTTANGLSLSTGSTTTVTNALTFTANATANAQTITMNGTANLNAASLVINAPTSTGASNITCAASATGTFTLTGTATITGNSTSTGAVTLGMLTCTMSAAGITINGGTNKTGSANITASTGTITTTNGLTFGGTVAYAKMTTTGVATINLVGTMSGGGTLSFVSGTVLKTSGTSAIDTAYTTLPRLWVTGGTTTLGALATQTTTGVQVDSGAVLANGGNLITSTCNGTGTAGFTINGTLSGTGGATLNTASCTIDGTGTPSFTGTLTLTNAKTVAATANLTFAAATIALSSSTVVTNNGIFSSTGANGITGTDGTSGWTQGTDATLKVTGALLATGALTASAAGNTVEYQGAAQTVKATTYHHLTLSGSGTKTMTSVASANGNLTMSGSAAATTDALATVGGNIALSGTATLTLGTVALVTVTGDITVGTGTTLTANVSTTVNGGDITVTSTGSMTTSSGTPTLTMGASGTIGGNGNITLYNLATSGTGTTVFSASGTNTVNNNVTVGASTTLTVSTSMTVNGGANGGVTVTGTLNVNAGTFTIGNGTDEDLNLPATTGGTANFNGGTTVIKDDILVSNGIFTIANEGTAVGFAGEMVTGDGDGGGAATTTVNLNNGSLSGSSVSASHFRFNGGTINLNGGTHSTGSDSIVEMARTYGSYPANVVFNMSGGSITTRGFNIYNNYTLTTTTVNGGTLIMGSGTTTPSFYDVNVTAHKFYNFQLTRTGNISASTTQTLTLEGALTIDAGQTFTANSKNIQAKGWHNHGTFTPGSGTVTLLGGNVDGDSDSGFNNLTIGDGTTTATITVNGTDDPTVSGTLDVDTGDTFSLDGGRMVTVANTGILTLDGTISGAGTLDYQSTTNFPTTGIITSLLRFNTTDGGGNTVPQRTYGGDVEFYNDIASGSYVVFMGTDVGQTINFSGNVTVNANNNANLTLSSDLSDPAVNITGNLDFTGGGGGTEYTDIGTGTWTVSGNIDLTGGIFGADAGGTLKMNGNDKTVTSDGNALMNFEPASASGYIQNVDALNVDGTFHITSGEFRQGANVNVNVADDFTIDSAKTFTKASGSGKLIFDGDLQFDDNTSPQQDLGVVEIGTSPDIINLDSNLKATSLAVKSGDTLQTDGWDLDIGTGGITIEGTLDATRNAGEGVTTLIYSEGSWTMNTGGAFTADNSTVTLDGSASKNIAGTAGTTFYNLTITTGDAVITASDHTVTGTLNVDTLRTLTINVSRILTLNSGGSLTLGGIITGAGRLIYKPSAAFPTGGTISSILRFDATDNNQTMSNRTYGGAVELYNTTAVSSRTVTGAAGTITLSSSVTLTQTGGKSVIWDLNTSDPSVTVNGAVTIGSTTEISASNSSILDLKGNYTNSGSFTDNLGTVRISGTSQQTFGGTMTGSSDFRSLTVTNAGAANPDVIFSAAVTANTFTATTASSQIQFLAGANYTFVNISLNGQDTGTRVTLSSSTTSQWNLKVSGTQSVSNTDVSYSNACSGDNIAAYDGTNNDGLNNDCWDFTNLISVTGVLYDTTRSTPYNCATDPLAPITIKISTSGRAAETTTCTLSNGTFTFSDVTGPLQAGDPVVVYVDSSETPQATTVTRGSGPFDDITGFDLYQNDVIVRHEDAGPVTNSDMSDGDNGDAGIRYNVVSGVNYNLTVDSGLNLYVWGGTYDAGGTLTLQGTADLYVAADAAAWLDTATNTITQNIDNYGTINISGTTNVTRDVYSRASSIFIAGASTTTGGSAYVYGQLTVNSGTFTVGDALVEDVTVYSGGTFTAGSTTDIKDDLILSTGGTASLTATVTIGGLVNVDAGALDISGDVDIDELIDQDGGTITISAGTTNLNTAGVASSVVSVDNAAFTVSGGTLTVGAGATDYFQVNSGATVALSGGIVNIMDDLYHTGGSTTISAGQVNLSSAGIDEDINLDGGTLTINGTADVNVGSDIDQDGGTLIIDGSADVDVADGLQMNGSGSTLTINSGTLDTECGMGGDTVLDEGIFNLNGGTFTVNPSGVMQLASSGSKSNVLYFNMTGGEIITFYFHVYDTATLTTTTVNGGTISLDLVAPSRYIDDENTDTHKFYNLRIKDDAGIEAGSGAMTIYLAGSLTIDNGKTFTANDVDMQIDNGWINNGGTFVPGAGTVTLRGGNISGTGDTTFNNLTIGDATTTTTIAVNNTDDPTVSGTLDVDTGDTLSIGSGRTVTHSGAAMTLDGTISGAGTLRFTNTSSGPGSTGILSSAVRYDASGGNIATTTFDARTYGGNVVAYSNVAAVRSIAMASGTHEFDGNLTVTTGASQSSVLTLDASTNPTVNITGDLSYSQGGSATPTITSGTGTWTVQGDVNFNAGTYTATAGNTISMTGNSTIYATGETLQNFAVTGGIIQQDKDLNVDGTFTVAGFFGQADEYNLNVAGDFTLESGSDFSRASGAGLLIFDGDLTLTDNTAPKQDLGNVEIGTSPDTVDLASDMAATRLNINNGDILNTNGYDLDIGTGGVDVKNGGTLNATGSGIPGETFINTEGNFQLDSGATFTQDQSTVTFDDSSGTDDLITDGAFSLYNLVIDDGIGSLTVEVEDALDVDNDVTITGGTLDVVSGENNAINVGGSWSNSDTFTPRSGTVTLDGSAVQQLNGTLTGAGGQFYDLIVTNDSAGGIDFNVSAQTANNFTVTTADVNLTFQAASTYTFQNINWNGQAVDTRVSLRSSSTDTQWNLVVSGSQTVLNVDAQDSYACGGDDIDATDSSNYNSSNNECWNFGLTLSGTLYKNETGTTYDCGLGGDGPQTVAVSVGGAAKDTGICISSGGTFSVNIKSPAGAGTPIVVFIDDEVVGEGTVATRAANATSSISGINVYKDVVNVRHEDGGPITNSDLDTADSAFDDDIKYTVTTNNLTVVSNFELHIGSSKTFDPGGTVTTQGTGSLHLATTSTMYVDTDTSSIANNITIGTLASLSIDASRSLTLNTGKTLTMSDPTSAISGAGTFIYKPSTAFPTGGTITSNLRFDSENNDQIVSARTYGGNVEIYNIEVAVGTRTITLGTGASQTISISGNLTLTKVGTRDINLTGATYSPTVNVVGNISFTAGGGSKLITSGSGTWTVTGNIDFTGGTYTASNTIKMNGTTKTITSAGNTLLHFQVDNASGTISNVDALNIDGNFYISKGAFSQGANVNINVAGNFTIENGYTFTKAASSGVLIFDESTVKDITDSTSPLQDLGNVQVTDGIKDLATNMKATSLQITGAATMRQDGYNLDIGGDVTITGSGSALWPSFGNINLEGSLTIGSGAALANYSGDSTVTFDGTSGTVDLITDSGCTFCDLTNIVIDDGGGSLVVQVEDPLVIVGNLTITGGTLDVVSGENNQINIDGNWANSDTFEARGGTVVFDGDGGTINNGSSTFYNVTFNDAGGSWSPLTNTMTVTNDMTVTNGTFNTSAGTADVIVNGHVQCGATCGTINMTSTNTFTQSVASAKNFGTNVAGTTAWTFYNLAFHSSSGTPTITFNGTATGNINVNNNLSFTNSGTSLTVDNETSNDRVLDVAQNVSLGAGTTFQASSTAAFNVGGNWSNSGIFTANSGTVTFDATDAGNTIAPGSSFFNHIDFNGASGDWTHTAALDVNGTFEVTNGTFIQAADYDVNVADDFTIANGAAFTKSTNTGLLIFDGDLTFMDSSSPRQDLGKVEIGTSPDTTDLASDMTATRLNINNGDVLNTNGWDLDIGTGGINAKNGGTLNATGDGESPQGETLINTEGDFQLDSGATFTQDQSTVTFDGGTGTVDLITDGAFSLYNLVLNQSDINMVVEVEDPLDVDNDVTVTAGTLDAKSGEDNAINVGGDWAISDVFQARSGTVTFDATDSGNTINPGSSSFYNLIFNGSGGAWSPLTNMVTATNDLTMTNGTFDTSSGTADVRVIGTVECGVSCGTINMTTTNTFTQLVSEAQNFGTNVAVGTHWTFYNLTFQSSSGTPTITFNDLGTGDVNVLHDLTLTNNGTSLTVDNETYDRNLDIDGSVSIGANTTLQASSTATFEVYNDWTNNGDFTAGNGTVTLDGATQQTLSGQMTGASDRFYNLTITNASAFNPDVVFAADAETAATFTANIANTQLQFLAGGTYTLQNINFDGQAENTRVFLRSSSTGTQWSIDVAGTRSVSNTDVRDSYACGTPPDIDATDGTNFNATNNDCWLFNTLTFTISDTTVGFGDLGAAAARWATGDGDGTGSQPAVGSGAHEIAVTTNAEGGYVLTYYGTNLASESDTITAATITGDGDGTPGSKQFAISASTTGNGTVETAYNYSSNNYSFVPITTTPLLINSTSAASDTIDVYYISNISGVTLPGSYSTSITYIVTATF